MHFSSPTPMRMNMSGTEAGVLGFAFTFAFCSIKTEMLKFKKTGGNQVMIVLNTLQQGAQEENNTYDNPVI